MPSAPHSSRVSERFVGRPAASLAAGLNWGGWWTAPAQRRQPAAAPRLGRATPRLPACEPACWAAAHTRVHPLPSAAGGADTVATAGSWAIQPNAINSGGCCLLPAVAGVWVACPPITSTQRRWGGWVGEREAASRRGTPLAHPHRRLPPTTNHQPPSQCRARRCWRLTCETSPARAATRWLPTL